MLDEQEIIELIVKDGRIPFDTLQKAIAQKENKGGTILDILSNYKEVDGKVLQEILARYVGLRFTSTININEIESSVVEKVPINFAKQHKLIPIKEEEDYVLVAIANPFDPYGLDDLRIIFGKEIEPIVAPPEEIINAINQVYERKSEKEELEELKEGGEEELQDILDLTDEAPIIRWVNSLFFQAVKERASDIHIEPGEKDVIIRFRIDGVLHEIKRANKGYLPSIISRIKIMAGLNIAEKRLPQDGRIALKIAGRNIDVRVSTIPTSQGERVVLRLLDKANVLLNLTDLGFSPKNLETITSLIYRPHGIILVTGPTGSGKTTTLYACISKINTPDKNILTVEDPVEYDIPGISQMPVNPKINLTFATGLRAFLRQDPDIIMVGEIRDRETAEIAIHASLTGHLVLSTIHTNDAAGAVTRLVEMGIEPFLVASSLMAVLAQRLVRVLCSKCKLPYEPEEEELKDIGFDPDLIRRENLWNILTELGYPPHHFPNLELKRGPKGLPIIYRAKGCEECQNTGYFGRTGIYELLLVNDEIRNLILKNVDSTTIKRKAMQHGMHTLREDGAAKVLLGLTSPQEVLRVTQVDIE